MYVTRSAGSTSKYNHQPIVKPSGPKSLSPDKPPELPTSQLFVPPGKNSLSGVKPPPKSSWF